MYEPMSNPDWFEENIAQTNRAIQAANVQRQYEAVAKQLTSGMTEAKTAQNKKDIAAYGRQKTKSMSAATQSLISSGLMSTTALPSMELGYEQEVGVPFREAMSASDAAVNQQIAQQTAQIQMTGLQASQQFMQSSGGGGGGHGPQPSGGGGGMGAGGYKPATSLTPSEGLLNSSSLGDLRGRLSDVLSGGGGSGVVKSELLTPMSSKEAAGKGITAISESGALFGKPIPTMEQYKQYSQAMSILKQRAKPYDQWSEEGIQYSPLTQIATRAAGGYIQ